MSPPGLLISGLPKKVGGRLCRQHRVRMELISSRASQDLPRHSLKSKRFEAVEIPKLQGKISLFTVRFLVGRARWVLGLALIVELAFLLRVPLLRASGGALVAQDQLASADLVIVPEWSGNPGALEAVDLVRSGNARGVAVLLAPSGRADYELDRRGINAAEFHDWLKGVISALGVPVQNIPSPASGTEAEAVLLLTWCTRNGIRSIIVVTSTDHSRRVRRVLRRTLAAGGIRIVVRAARYSEFDPDAWWKSRDGVRTEIVELEKLALDIVRHPFN
jgi:hypothetical protein